MQKNYKLERAMKIELSSEVVFRLYCQGEHHTVRWGKGTLAPSVREKHTRRGGQRSFKMELGSRFNKKERRSRSKCVAIYSVLLPISANTACTHYAEGLRV